MRSSRCLGGPPVGWARIQGSRLSERFIKQSRVTSPCVLPGLGPIRGRTVLDNLQSALAFVVLFALVLVYRGSLGSLLRFLADHPSQAAIVVMLYAIVYGQVGNALGIPYLFWNEEPVTRLLAAAEATLLLATIGITAYFLLDEEEHRIGMQRVADFLDRWSIQWPLAFLERGREEAETAWELTRFLRFLRWPFLTALVLPAVLPGAWFCSGVPKYAPWWTRSASSTPGSAACPMSRATRGPG